MGDIEQQIENMPYQEAGDRLVTKLKSYKETRSKLEHELHNYQLKEKKIRAEFKNNFSEKMDKFHDSRDDFISTSNSTNQP